MNQDRPGKMTGFYAGNPCRKNGCTAGKNGKIRPYSKQYRRRVIKTAAAAAAAAAPAAVNRRQQRPGPLYFYNAVKNKAAHNR